MSPRRVLGDMSPNVKAAQNQHSMTNKPMAGSLLKRSYTAMMGEEAGFTYLKSRKLSADKPLSEVEVSRSSTRSVFDSASAPKREATRLRALDLSLPTEMQASAVPAICEPSPTEPNTPSECGDGTQDSSAERRSFSSLINYDPSSQTTHFAVKSTSRAEMLKLRLRVAMYKVRTNQVHVPFAHLRVTGGTVGEKPQDGLKRATNEAVEEGVAELRREAQQRLSLIKRRIPKLLPAPVLLPTAYSSRMIHEPLLPSSPPGSRSPEKTTQARTPRRSAPHFSSPPDSAERRTLRDAELTSSVVKGRVAEGLLGLRHAV